MPSVLIFHLYRYFCFFGCVKPLTLKFLYVKIRVLGRLPIFGNRPTGIHYGKYKTFGSFYL